MHIYEPVYKKVDFLKNKNQKFISWICPLLKGRVASPKEFIGYEGYELDCIFFVRQGQCDYVLPKYTNQTYITNEEHTCFGVVDFIASLLQMNQKAANPE